MPASTADRPRKRRRGARVVVLAGDEVLLQGDRDPFIPGSRFWQTPGGGIDDGETEREAAARELAEESGIVVNPAELLGPVATRTVTHGYSDRILIQHETYFLARVERVEPEPGGLTEREQARHVATGWFPITDLPVPTWPAQLAALAAWDGGPPIDLGDVEESTLPVLELLDGAAHEQRSEDEARDAGQTAALAEGADR